MEIVKQGNLEKIKEKIKFTCHRCGCEFIAEAGEYKNYQSQIENCKWHEVFCPCCKAIVQQDY